MARTLTLASAQPLALWRRYRVQDMHMQRQPTFLVAIVGGPLAKVGVHHTAFALVVDALPQRAGSGRFATPAHQSTTRWSSMSHATQLADRSRKRYTLRQDHLRTTSDRATTVLGRGMLSYLVRGFFCTEEVFRRSPTEELQKNLQTRIVKKNTNTR